MFGAYHDSSNDDFLCLLYRDRKNIDVTSFVRPIYHNVDYVG